jgi:hypothetical protein
LWEVLRDPTPPPGNLARLVPPVTPVADEPIDMPGWTPAVDRRITSPFA